MAVRSLSEILEEAERMERELDPVIMGDRHVPNISPEQMTRQIIDLTKIVVRLAKATEGKI